MGLCAGFLYWPRSSARPLNGPFYDRRFAELEAMFSDVESAYAVGCRYLGLADAERDLAALLKTAGLNSIDPNTPVRSAIQLQRQDDFRTGNTLILDGWVLAKAEVSVCAVLVLCHRDA